MTDFAETARRALSYVWKHGVASTLKHASDVRAVRRIRQLRNQGDAAAYAAEASHLDFGVFDTARPAHLHDLTPTERRLYLDVSDLACQVPEAVAQLARCVEYTIKAGIPGAFVECGVYKGASPYVIAHTLKRLGVTDREVWLYDTFEGMPQPTELDVYYKLSEGDDWTIKHWEAQKDETGSGSQWVRSSEEEARENVFRSGYPKENFRFVKGMVEDTIPEHVPDQIALLRLDTDFHSSVSHEMEHMFPRLATGGVLIIDDYGAFEGARKAVDDYVSAHGIKLCLFRIDENVRGAVKLG